MNTCDQDQRLTPFLLGDLPGPEADAVRRHLAQCAVCQESVRQIEPTLAALRSALAHDADTHLQFSPVRRASLLAVRPQPRRRIIRWLRAHRSLLAAAACITLILGSMLMKASGSACKTAAACRAAMLECSVANTEVDLPTAGPVGGLLADNDTDDDGLSTSTEFDRSDGTKGILSGNNRAFGDLSGDGQSDDGKNSRENGREECKSVNVSGMLTRSAGHGFGFDDKRSDSLKGWTRTQPDSVAPPSAVPMLAPAKHDKVVDDIATVRSPATMRDVSIVLSAGESVRGESEKAKRPLDGRRYGAVKGGKDQTWFKTDDARAEIDGDEGKLRRGSAIEQKKHLDQQPGRMNQPTDDKWERPSAETGASRDIVRQAEVDKKRTSDQENLKRMRETVIPEIDFRGANIQDVADFFSSASKEFGEGRDKGIEFVPPKQTVAAASTVDPFAPPSTPAPISVRMRQVSMLEAAKIVADVSGTELRFQDGKAVFVPVNLPDSDSIPNVPAKPTQSRVPAVFNSFVDASVERFSTFSIDIDTASYTLTRQSIRAGRLPDPEVVRTEEIVNAFDYGDTAPDRTTFRVHVEGAPSPFGSDLMMLRIGVKGRRLGREEQRPAMLTFLIDTSGSMAQPDRIGLARISFRLLLENLASSDRIQIVAYDDRARVVLDPTPASQAALVLAAFDALQCTGSTNLEDGMRKAYELAARAFIPGAENRVILVSDGVANLGTGDAQEILAQIDTFRRQGITCSVFGVGKGTYNDQMLEQLANKGDGVYRFLDSEEEARRAFVEDLAATLNTIAADVKIQVEWNPSVVRRYRQIGYENRALTKEQFRDNTVDAGEVGSGQSVTALYELETDSADTARRLSLGTVRVRYRRTDTHAVEEIATPIMTDAIARNIDATRPQFKLAVGAAEFAEILRVSPYAAGSRFENVARLLRPVALAMPLDTRVRELLSLAEQADALGK